MGVNWSGKRDSNSWPQPWHGCALPTELYPRKGMADVAAGQPNPFGCTSVCLFLIGESKRQTRPTLRSPGTSIPSTYPSPAIAFTMALQHSDLLKIATCRALVAARGFSTVRNARTPAVRFECTNRGSLKSSGGACFFSQPPGYVPWRLCHTASAPTDVGTIDGNGMFIRIITGETHLRPRGDALLRSAHKTARQAWYACTVHRVVA